MITSTRAGGMVTYRRRERSLWASMTSVLAQPVTFFRTLPAARQWVWVALIILAVTGFSAVNQPSADDVASDVGMMPVQPMPDMPGIPAGPGGGFIPPQDIGGEGVSSNAPDVSKTVMTALLAAGGVILAWLIQALLLCEVSLINGVMPNFGRGLQIAVWASVPLALMLIIQQVYYAIGGKPGEPGLSLLLERWDGFANLPAFSQTVLRTLLSNFTLFWLWSLALLYIGGRNVFEGKRAAVMLVVVAWVIISAILPALTATPEVTPEAIPDTINLPSMPEGMDGIEGAEGAENFTGGELAPEGDVSSQIVPMPGGRGMPLGGG